MSVDLVALVRGRPDVHAVADGLVAMGEPLELRGGELEPTRLYDTEGRLLVSIEDPVQVVLQSEIGRLLGPDFESLVTTPVWWVDVRAVSDLPDAVRIARKFTEALVHWVGGTSYPEGKPDTPPLSWRAPDASDPAEGAQPVSDPAFPGGVIGG